jgi:hypothetical protein
LASASTANDATRRGRGGNDAQVAGVYTWGVVHDAARRSTIPTMLKRTAVCLLTLAALAATPAVAGAADTVVVPGVAPQRLAALDGTLVWVTGAFPNNTLMQRSPDGTIAPVNGAAKASYRSIDLGHDTAGKLVLTYLRCAGTKDCKPYSDDLAGHRVTFKHLAPTRCTVSAAPSRWDSRVAYGLDCDKLDGKPGRHDAKRSGLFVRRGSAAPKHLELPKDANHFGVDFVRWVDLRGTIVGAAVTDVYSYAFSQTVNRTHMKFTFAAASEGDSDENIVGQSLGAGGLLWTLVDSEHAGDPNEARISKVVAADCADYETLANAPGPNDEDGYRAETLAVDGSTLYLFVRGTGIVTHTFAPTFACH